MRNSKIVFIIGLLSFNLSISAQHILSLEDALNRKLIQTEGRSSVNWLDDGEHYSCIESNEEGVNEVVCYRAKDNKKETLIPAKDLIDSKTNKPIAVESFTFSADNQKILIYNNSRRVWRYNTRGDYWVLNRKTGTLYQLGAGLPESSLMFAKFSPDGNKVAYVSKNNIYVEDLVNKTRKAITTDGNDTIVNGTFDWVYEEEFDCRDGFCWSGDGQYIAYWQSNTSGTGWFDIIDNVDSLYPTVKKFPYPKAGTTNSAVKVGYIAVDGGKTTWIDIPGNPRENYIPRMIFIPGTNELFIQQMNRPQNMNKVWTVTIGKNNLTNIFTDEDSAWVETNDNVQWLENNRYFTWASEKDGWRHLYRVSKDGKDIHLITKGDFDFIKEVGTDLQKGYIYFIATPTNYTQRYLYRSSLMGDGTCICVSPEDEIGQHSYCMSPSGKWAVHTFSNAETPPVIDMVRFPDVKSIQMITTNENAKKAYQALGLNAKEFVKATSDNLKLDAWLIKPVNFDATKKYPVILDIYGEPASSTVQDSWGGGDLWHQFLANQGYIVISIDGRGTATPRGREWRKCIYGEVGTLASKDIAQGILDLARQYSFIDTTRIGVTGWSGGGSQTLNCMFRYPSVFRTGIAVAFVADQKLYDTIYQERYMNTPQNNPDGYQKGSPINYVSGLKGNLLLMHGTGDDNVHYQNSERLVNELIKNGKIFYQISYPMRSHGIFEGKGTSLHVRKTMIDFWRKYLPAGPVVQ